MTRLRVAFFYERPPDRMPSYVRQDYETLSRRLEVRWCPSAEGAGWRRGIGPTDWLPSVRQARAARWADVVLMWFALPAAPAIAARLFLKPLVVITGGYDVAAVPEIGYGRMLGRRTRSMGIAVLRLATRVLCISRFIEGDVLRFAPGCRTRVVPLGFDATAFGPAPAKDHRVVTVGAVSDEYVPRKGLDSFAKASCVCPGIPFEVVGKIVSPSSDALLRRLGGPNLSLSGEVSNDQLRERLARAAVYAQLSLHEGFGCAVAEAMLSGCTPIVSDRGALPEVVGDSGYYVPARDANAAAAAITRALKAGCGERARRRIEVLFPAAARERRLLEEIESAAGSAHSR